MINWYRIDTAPKIGERLLLCIPIMNYHTVVVGYWDEGWFTDEGVSINPSHWKPLPEPPKEKFSDTVRLFHLLKKFDITCDDVDEMIRSENGRN